MVAPDSIEIFTMKSSEGVLTWFAVVFGINYRINVYFQLVS